MQPIVIKNRSGFSLIEFIIAFALMALLILLAIPHMGFLQRRFVKADAEELLSTMLYMQREAMVSNTKKKLNFLVLKNQYHYNSITRSLSQGVMFGIINGVAGPPSKQEKSPKAAVTYENQEIVFWPDGKMSPGSVYLTNTERDVMYAVTTPISHISYIRMYCYFRGNWEQIR
jgi:Tfp pilus assembly protein FimT